VDVRADIEIGGSDQTFNLLVGRELQRQAGQRPQCVLTMPLLVGLDGVKKMSKSYGNYIGISEEPREMFGKAMSMADHLMPEYFLLALGYQAREVEALKSQLASGELHPRDLKDRLGREIVATYYDEQAAADAAEEFLRVFREKDLPDEMEVRELTAGEVPPLDKLITDLGMTSSRREAKGLISQGAVKIDSDTQKDPRFVLEAGDYILKVGKRKFCKVVVKK
jgi:tyrosyl-tRNA synthetase